MASKIMINIVVSIMVKDERARCIKHDKKVKPNWEVIYDKKPTNNVKGITATCGTRRRGNNKSKSGC